MKRLAFLLALAAATAAQAEVSVDRNPGGTITAHFEPALQGPWTRVRVAVPFFDILNENGDVAGDAWPRVFDNGPLVRPEAVWSTAGQDADVMTSHHDGLRWTPPSRLSTVPGADTMPAVATDKWGNRFITWDRERNSRHGVIFTGLAADDGGQLANKELSSRPRQGRAPSLVADDDGIIWVGYEEAVSANDPTIAVACDRIAVQRNSNGVLQCGGEVPIDLARSVTFVTKRAAGEGSADVRLNGEEGHVWITWVDSNSQVGYSRLDGGVFTESKYRDYADPSEIAGIREEIRRDILNP